MLVLRNLDIVIVDYGVQYDNDIEIEVSWSSVTPVLLERNIFTNFSYYTMQDHRIFQYSDTLSGDTTSTTVVVRDPLPGLQHVFIVRSFVKTQNATYEGPEDTLSKVIGQSPVVLILWMLHNHIFSLSVRTFHSQSIFSASIWISYPLYHLDSMFTSNVCVSSFSVCVLFIFRVNMLRLLRGVFRMRSRKPFSRNVLLAGRLPTPFSVVEASFASPAPPWPRTAPFSSTLTSLALPMLLAMSRSGWQQAQW